MPSEDVTSLPVVARQADGLVLIGRASALRELLAGSTGQARIQTQALGGGEFLVQFEGDFMLTLERGALARSDVRILFQPGRRLTNGIARLSFFDGSSFRFPAGSIELPLSALAGSRAVQGTGLVLDARGPAFDLYQAVAHFDAERVTLVQRFGRGR